MAGKLILGINSSYMYLKLYLQEWNRFNSWGQGSSLDSASGDLEEPLVPNCFCRKVEIVFGRYFFGSVIVIKAAAVTVGRVGEDMQDNFFYILVFHLTPQAVIINGSSFSFGACVVLIW